MDRVVDIKRPVRGIREDVGADGLQFAVIADDVVVVAALADGCACHIAEEIDAAGRCGFEIADDGAQGSGGQGGSL